jgi:hypothetical protein
MPQTRQVVAQSQKFVTRADTQRPRRLFAQEIQLGLNLGMSSAFHSSVAQVLPQRADSPGQLRRIADGHAQPHAVPSSASSLCSTRSSCSVRARSMASIARPDS